eukprot:TRINITY_DN20718_c0_g1_i2.p1 TRINITY_DN20718_c0_g1~~TRINITY_DN20718_c0_g1_i2.p1  ORF type:complete len:285 (-),score=14.61 TRINITY_DN20718_c0_g1_i2:44-898(-)
MQTGTAPAVQATALNNPEILQHVLAPLAIYVEGQPSDLLPIRLAYQCACVNKAWESGVSFAVEGLVVGLIAMTYVYKPHGPRFGQDDKRERAKEYGTNHVRLTTQALAWSLKRFPRLQSLYFTSKMGDLSHIQAQVLALNLGCKFSPIELSSRPQVDDLLAMSLGRHCPRLESLHGVGLKYLSMCALCFLVQSCKELRQLTLYGIRIPDGDVRSWHKGLRLLDCRVLDLSFVAAFDDKCLREVAKSCRGMEFLGLGHTSVSDGGLDLRHPFYASRGCIKKCHCQ